MSRILDLVSSSDPIPEQTDAEFENYNNVEKRLIVKCGGSKAKLLKLYRRVKERGALMSGAKHAVTVNESTGPCTPTYTEQLLESDLLRANGNYGAGVKMVGNELFVGEPGALGSIFVVGEVHYYTRPDASSNWTRQSGFFSPTQTNGGQFGNEIDYDGSRVIVAEPNVAQRANIFTFSGGTATSEQEIVANDLSGRFSEGVAIQGSHALIGAPSDAGLTPGTNEGGVEYWTESGGTWTHQQTFYKNGAKANNQYFGQSIAMSDDSTAFIIYTDVADAGQITVQRWTRSGTTWSFASEFNFSYTNPGANFAKIDTDGTSLIIGQDGWDEGVGTNEGVVIVCDLTGTVTSTIIGDAGDDLGSGVTIDGTEAVLGRALSEPSGTSNAGSAEVWEVCV